MLEALREPRRALALAGAYRPLAERALADAPIDPDDALGILRAPDDALAGLLWAAYAVRGEHFGRRVKLCVLNNARSGLCPEDCGYCSQSAVSTAEIARYRVKPVTELVAGARQAAAAGARRYCMVTSARGPSPADVEHFGRAAQAIRAALPDLELCVSLGIMGDDAARALRGAGVDYVNHNLNTSRRHCPAICDAHLRRPRRRGAQRAARPDWRRARV